MMDFIKNKKLLPLMGILVSGIAIATFEHIHEDKTSIFELLYDSIEKSLIIMGAAGVVFLIYRSHKEEEERSQLLKELNNARVEGKEWRTQAQSFTKGLGQEIEKQFSHWGLSDAEMDVALLMIKGFSHKEIANLRGTAESTVRQQARCIYQKSGIQGKAAFCAYFLEDLLPPQKN